MEREAQLSRLERLIGDGAQGSGSVALIDGPAASGKSRLLSVTTHRATAGGALALRAAGSPAESALPYGVFDQLLHGVPLPAEVARQTELLTAAGRDPRPGGAGAGAVDAATARAFEALGRALLELAAGQPLVITVDDVHHADQASIRFLLYFARRISTARALVLLTIEETVDGVAPLRSELLRLPHLHRIGLSPLSRHGVAELLAARLGPSGLHLAEEFAVASGGNLALLQALVEDHLAAGRVRLHGYGQALVGQLRRGPGVVGETAAALAVLGSDATPETVAALADLPAGSVASALEAMTTTGLLADGGFRHPLARAAVLQDLSPRRRCELHRGASRLLHHRDAPAASVARHLVEADHHREPWALDALQEAADHAIADGDDRAAADFLELALRACADERTRATVRARLLQVEWRANPPSAVRHLTPLAGAAQAEQLSHRDHVALVRQLLWHGQAAAATQALERLTGPAEGPGAAAPGAWELDQWLAWSHPHLARPRRSGTGRPHGAGGLSEVDPWLAPAASLAQALTRARGAEAAAAAEEALGDLTLGHPTPWAEEAAALAITVLISANRAGDARDWCDRLLADPVFGDSPRWRAVLVARKAEASLQLGDLMAAAAQARAALRAMPPKSWGVAVGHPLGSLLLATTRMGRFDEAAECLTQFVPEAMLRTRWGLHYLHARGHYYLATNHHHAAVADFLACGELMREWGVDVPGLVPWRTSAAEAWLRLGNPDRAKNLLYEQLARPGTPRTRALALHLLATAGPAGRKVQLLSEALELFEDSGDIYEQARTLTDLGHAHYASHDRQRARTLHRRARHLATMCEALPLCRHLLTVPGEPGGAADEPTDDGRRLTDSELRVASLAIRGYTNREIANKLYVTASTVEQHLTRVYRKLGVKGRRDLPADLKAGEPGLARTASRAA
ncbi:AAA family ATPase [Kitasatospora sp. NPDC036755]|uniref:helix-turn-helix transcriptional regulator n=1 Tax=Kitasatospora sp. NPDC036755 TaxID=3154600 RepID=UPI0033DD4A19